MGDGTKKMYSTALPWHTLPVSDKSLNYLNLTITAILQKKRINFSHIKTVDGILIFIKHVHSLYSRKILRQKFSKQTKGSRQH